MTRKAILEIIIALMVLLFAYTSVSKIVEHDTFQFQLSRAPYIGLMAEFVSLALPLLEIAVVVLLVWKKTRLIGLWASLLMMLLFTGYVGLMLLSGLHLPCTCGGVIQKLSWPQHLVFNMVFTIVAIAGIVLTKRSLKHSFNNANDYSVKLN